jgi:hypothetical protein
MSDTTPKPGGPERGDRAIDFDAKYVPRCRGLRRAMTEQKRKSSGFLNLMQMKVLFSWNGDLVSAARAAGYKNPRAAALKLMRNPVFTYNLQRKQESMAEESGKILGQQLTVSRAEVINRLWELARMSPTETHGTIYGQIKAAETLAYVFDIKINRPADLDREVRERTSAEVDFFVKNGYFPDRAVESGDPENQTPKSHEK